MASAPAAARVPHVVLAAWAELGLGPTDFDAVELLKRGSKSAVYRLHGRPRVVAKRCRAAAAAVERAVQEEVLPATCVSAPRFYGLAPDPDVAFVWLFLEDAGDIRYSAADPAHAAAAGRWLAALHGASAPLVASVALPDRSVAQQRTLLTAARDALRAALPNPALASAGGLLRRLLAYCDELDTRWRELESMARALPPTLVHGGFAGKNVRVRPTRDGLDVLAFDWEAAGWGMPAADLSKVDLAAYRRASSSVDAADLERFAAAGAVLWCVAAIPGEAENLAAPWAARLRGKLDAYEEGMRRGLARWH